MREAYFKIGEFAQILGVKKATLIHYAKIGLMPPHHIGENGYYYYLPGQIYDYELICILRGMSFSLEEIKAYMSDASVDNCRQIFAKQLKALQEKQKYLSNIENIVQKTLDDLDSYHMQEMDQVEIVELTEPMRYLVYELPYRTEQAAYEMADVARQIRYWQANFMQESINVIEVVLEKDVKNGSFAKTYGGFRAKDDVPEEDVYVRPAGTYVTMASNSGGDQIPFIYHRLAQWAFDHGYEICGDAFEEDLLTQVVARDRRKYPVRCYLQVKKK